MKTAAIRKAFFEYFQQHQHQWVPSSSLIPNNDPTLLFTNAGMVQFKETFLGQEPRAYTRAVTAQRCVRAGGKHNDLENVGYTARHHTFFEMLGNFSFGDYFKRDAIQFAWRFLTTVLNLPEERLWVTVYQEDDEAAEIWLKEIGVSAERFSRCGDHDNFWSMGDTGPCGPCSEIFYDHGPEIAGGPPGSPEADGDRYIEIWNLVFMQYNRDKHGQLHPLPKPSVDTGMGLERLAAVVQGVHSNYEIDDFQYLIQAITKLGQLPVRQHPSLNVIADHIRSCSFLIADGVMPSHDGRGYVLRRIIRRAVRHGHKLGLPMPFFSRLVEPLIHVMGQAYPELVAQRAQIERILEQEEHQFVRTLDQGLRLLQTQIQSVQGKQIDGETAFKLYDTYGFPLDLTADIAREHHLTVDFSGFEQCMAQQRAQSQSASSFQVDYAAQAQLDVCSVFHGYTASTNTARVLAILENGYVVETLQVGNKAAIVLDETPFYAESGGQVGDTGELVADGLVFRVDDTQRQGQAILHYGELCQGQLQIGQSVTASIDVSRRQAIRLNHTATHLLHAALQQHLGAHVQQKGSLVDADRARFDFVHFAALTADELADIEYLVNQQIRLNHVVQTDVMSRDDAAESGAMALFGEKYGDSVRVLSMGSFSKELCGGTHASRTGEIGLFKITSEYGVASGVRRIEFVTGEHACRWVTDQLAILNEVATQLKAKPEQAVEKLTQWIQTNKQQEKTLQQLQQTLAVQSGRELRQSVQTVGEFNVLIKRVDHTDGAGLRQLLDQLKSMLDRAIIVLYTVTDDKLSVLASVSAAIQDKAPSAADLVKCVCGKGGGRPDMAQGGGPVPDDLDARLAKVMELIRG